MEKLFAAGFIALAIGILFGVVVSLRERKYKDAFKYAMLFAITSGVGTLLALIEPVPSSEAVADGHLTPSKEFIWIRANQRLIAAKLKDPDSAQFGSGDRVSYKAGGPVVCGTVNARNSFGAYGGMQRYIGMGDKMGVYLADEVSDFDKMWQKVCS